MQRTLADMARCRSRRCVARGQLARARARPRPRRRLSTSAIFTNLSPEHLNFHGTFEAYRAAKARLFERLPADGLAVLNADDPSSAFMQSLTAAPVVTFGFDPRADIRAADVHLAPNGTTFTVQPAGLRIESRLLGRFNVANWLAALAAATYFGATPHDLVTAARVQQPVPGRMNLVDRGQPFAVVVDFAHTPQALANAIAALRDLGCRRLLAGLWHGRRVAMRPIGPSWASWPPKRRTSSSSRWMTRAERTPPRSPTRSLAAPSPWAPRGASASRSSSTAARRFARSCERARPGDVVLLAGKGHEQRMVVGDTPQPWNDAQVATDELERLGYRKQAVP